jgi:AraC family transcriptional regulator
MEWLEGMNRALDYLEAHLEDEADIGEAARIAYSSKFHFQRMFSVLCGVTAADYLRARRLTLAAQELAAGGGRVLDAALRFGYETPEAFARAFKRFHGVSPSEAREPGVRLRSVSRLKFILSVKGDQDMDYRIMKKDAFRVVGKALRVRTDDGQNFTKIPEFWTECNADGTADRLMALSDDGSCLGICAEFNAEMNEFSYLVAVPSTACAVPEGCRELAIPAQTWAVFDAVGRLPQSIQTVTTKIFSEWFPASHFEHADAPELEVYLPGDMDDDNYRCEVWMPVVKKQ